VDYFRVYLLLYSEFVYDWFQTFMGSLQAILFQTMDPVVTNIATISSCGEGAEVYAQFSIRFGYSHNALSVFFCNFINTTAYHLGRKEPSYNVAVTLVIWSISYLALPASSLRIVISCNVQWHRSNFNQNPLHFT